MFGAHGKEPIRDCVLRCAENVKFLKKKKTLTTALRQMN